MRCSCGRLYESGNKCTECEREPERETSHRRGYTRRWSKISQHYLRANPMCVHCGGLATETDHVVPHRGDMELFYDANNWQALCRACHSRKTQAEVMGR